MAKKNEEELDYTRQPQATNQAEVDAQDTRTRLYQSLGYSYGKQMEESDQNYAKAIAQQNSSMLSKGMQRSSLAAQAEANLRNQAAKARNQIGEAFIADYQSRLSQLEEAEAARRFQTSEREATQAYNTAERIASQQYSTAEREEQQKYNTAERIAQQGYSTAEREAQQRYSTAEREAQQRYSTAERIAQQGFTTAEREAQERFSAEQSALQREQEESQFAEQMAFQREQASQSNAQFEQQMALEREKLEYSKMSTDQQLVFNYIETALKNGSDVSDELLARVGMTRADFNIAKAAAKSSGGGGQAAWQKAGFASEAEYNAAKALGITDPAKYQQYLQKQISSSFMNGLNNFRNGHTESTSSSTAKTTASTPTRGADTTTVSSGSLDKLAFLYNPNEDISEMIR